MLRSLILVLRNGVPVSLDGEKSDGVTLIRKLNIIGGSHGVGRTDMIEDRVLGIKARENYEHPAATILLMAHKDLERLVLTRDELRFKALSMIHGASLLIKVLWMNRFIRI